MLYIMTVLSPHYMYEKLPPITRRVIGYFEDIRTAINSVSDGSCNMPECLLSYLVIESIPPGLHPVADAERWYKWNGSKFILLKHKPKMFRNMYNFGAMNQI